MSNEIREKVLLAAGQLTGLAMRHHVEQYEEVAADKELTATNAALIRCVVRFRKDLEKTLAGKT
jgi:hypothetical protein